MKKLTVSILLACLNIINIIAADTVHFGWGYSDPIANFRIYTGAVPGVGEEVWVIQADQRRAGVPVPDNHYAWITAQNSAGLESESSPALQYRPTTVELVIQQSKNLREWGGRIGVFVFRVPHSVVGQLEQRLLITKTHVMVRAYGNSYSVPIPTGVGKKFFRSYVAVVP